MEIILREPRTLIGEKYLIKVTETEEEYLGKNIGFFIFDHIILYKENKKIIEAKRRFKPFRKIHFDITYNEKKGHLKQLTWFNPSYELNLDGKVFEIIEHWGKKKSIFNKSSQIATITQMNTISFNQNDTFKLLINDDEDFIPFILATMILDAPGNESSSDNLITFDLGNIGGEKKPFNKNWKPKIK